MKKYGGLCAYGALVNLGLFKSVIHLADKSPAALPTDNSRPDQKTDEKRISQSVDPLVIIAKAIWSLSRPAIAPRNVGLKPIDRLPHSLHFPKENKGNPIFYQVHKIGTS